MVLLQALDEHYLYDPLNRSSELYKQDYEAKITAMYVYQDLLLSLYIVFALLFYIFIYAPMINKLGRDTRNAWNMCTLIAQEHAEEFKRLGIAIKERKDNFKWR